MGCSVNFFPIIPHFCKNHDFHNTSSTPFLVGNVLTLEPAYTLLHVQEGRSLDLTLFCKWWSGFVLQRLNTRICLRIPGFSLFCGPYLVFVYSFGRVLLRTETKEGPSAELQSREGHAWKAWPSGKILALFSLKSAANSDSFGTLAPVQNFANLDCRHCSR